MVQLVVLDFGLILVALLSKNFKCIYHNFLSCIGGFIAPKFPLSSPSFSLAEHRQPQLSLCGHIYKMFQIFLH